MVASAIAVRNVAGADGRLDGTYAGQVIAIGSGAGRSVVADASLQLAVNEADQSGFSGVDVPSGADSLMLRLETTLEGGMIAGTVRLVAITDPDCGSPASSPSSDGSQGAPGCPGQTQTPIETASWNL